MPMTLMAACNDWRNGNCREKADSFELFECELSGGNDIKVAFRNRKLPDSNAAEGDHTLIFGRLKLPCLGCQTWVGNWCWDAFRLRLIHAVAVWNYLTEQDGYHCEGGPGELFDLFNTHGKIDPKTAPEFLTRILHPERYADAAIKGGLAK